MCVTTLDLVYGFKKGKNDNIAICRDNGIKVAYR